MPRAKKVPPTKFHFAVGRAWDKTDPNSPVGFYAYGSEIFHGTLAAAIKFRDRCTDDSDKKDKTHGPYKIYQVVEIPQSDTLKCEQI